jgi:transcriptional regulator with XRE-family HTH domain
MANENWDREDARKRVKYVLEVIWGGKQREMARAVGITQSLISKVVSGLQPPGKRVMEALAKYPAINADWALHGTGHAIEFPQRGSLPIAFGVLPVPPLEAPHLLSGSRHPVADQYDRNSRYWLLLTEQSPVVRHQPHRLASNDLLLLETDAAWTRRTDLVDGRLCGVRLQAAHENEYHLGRVKSRSTGLVVELFDGEFVIAPTTSVPKRRHSAPVRRRVRFLDREVEKKGKREAAQLENQQKLADGLPIAPEDIVAVQVYMVRPVM